MRKRLIGIPLAGLLIVGGATVALAQSGTGGTAAAPATGPAASGQPGGGPPGGGVGRVPGEGGGPILNDVLKDLVTNGTINQQQSDAITKALQDRRTELRDQAQKLREQMRTFLEDGKLSADELAQLPEDNPLRHLDQFLQDGQITQDELRQLRGLGHFGHGLGRGHGPGGPGIGPGGPDKPDDQAVPTPDSSGAPTS